MGEILQTACHCPICGSSAVLYDNISTGGDPIFRCSCGSSFVKWYAEEKQMAITSSMVSTFTGSVPAVSGQASEQSEPVVFSTAVVEEKSEPAESTAQLESNEPEQPAESNKSQA